MKKLGAVLLLAGAVVMGLSVAAVATPPNPDHKVTICHAHPADTAAQGWVEITVDVASVGYKHAGHESEHDADIIPAYSYTAKDGTTFTYDGKNLDTDFDSATGAEILANGCSKPDESPSPTPSPTESPSPSESPSPTPSDSSTPPNTVPSPPNHKPRPHKPSVRLIPPISGSVPPTAETGGDWAVPTGIAAGLLVLGTTLSVVARRKSAI